MLKKVYKYEVFESGSGSLTLFVLDDNGNPVYGHGGYQFYAGDLSHDIEVLQNGTDIDDWDGNLEAWMGYGGYVIPKTLEEWYEEVSESEELVADQDGYYPENMGIAAESEFADKIERRF